MPFGWVAGDDEFGRASAFRAALRQRRLLRPEPASAARIAEEVSRVLRRNEEARIYHGYAKTGRFPPRRGQPDG